MPSFDGHTKIGPRTKIYPFASVGLPPQDLKFKGELSTLEIGADCTIREQVTMNPGTEGGGLVTRVGSNCLFMVGAHVAHDCQVGDGVVMANNATLAGHVCVGDYAVIGGLAAVHQFVRIGAHAMIGGMSGVEHDVIPYGSAMGDRARLTGLNIVGLRRRGFSRDDVQVLRKTYRLLFAPEGTLTERIERRGRALRSGRAGYGTSLISFAQTRAAPCYSREKRVPRKLGIVAGGGNLPAVLIEVCLASRRPCHVLALEGHAEPDKIGTAVAQELGTAWRSRPRRSTSYAPRRSRRFVFAGHVRRPSLQELRPDLRAAKFLAKGVLKWRRRPVAGGCRPGIGGERGVPGHWPRYAAHRSSCALRDLRSDRTEQEGLGTTSDVVFASFGHSARRMWGRLRSSNTALF